MKKLLVGILFGFQIITNAQSGKIFPKPNEVKQLFSDGVFTETVAVSPEGNVYFSDMTIPEFSNNQAGHLYYYSPSKDSIVLFRSPSGFTNGMAFGKNGDLYTVQNNVANSPRDVQRTDMKTGKAYIVTNSFEGKDFNSPNDIVIDKSGRIYFTDVRYMDYGTIEIPFFGVYMIDLDGKVSAVIKNLSAPNGITISPDQKYLYVAEHPYTSLDNLHSPGEFGHMKIVRYALDKNGIPVFDKIFVDYGFKEGADGIKVDSNGNVYAAVRDENRKGIYVYSPDGTEIDYLPTPEKPANLAFGKGNYKNTLYIAAGKSLYSVNTARQGNY